jgi:hypothetical protein
MPDTTLISPVESIEPIDSVVRNGGTTHNSHGVSMQGLIHSIGNAASRRRQTGDEAKCHNSTE